jgi:hypothetical protein
MAEPFRGVVGGGVVGGEPYADLKREAAALIVRD